MSATMTGMVKRRRGRPRKLNRDGQSLESSPSSSQPLPSPSPPDAAADDEEEDLPPVLSPSEAETAMIVALINGGRLGWGKPRDEPWWPCIATRSYDLLHHFTTTDASSRVSLRTGQVLAYFLGDDTYDIVDEAWFEVGFPLRKPVKAQLAARVEYAEGHAMGVRLQARLDALDDKEEDKLRTVMSKGTGRMVQVLIDKDAGDAGKGQEKKEDLSYMRNIWWPAVAFDTFQVAAKAELGLTLPERALSRGETLVFKLGSWVPPTKRWEVVKRCSPFVLPSSQSSMGNSSGRLGAGEGGGFQPCMQEVARTEAQDLLASLDKGETIRRPQRAARVGTKEEAVVVGGADRDKEMKEEDTKPTAAAAETVVPSNKAAAQGGRKRRRPRFHSEEDVGVDDNVKEVMTAATTNVSKKAATTTSSSSSSSLPTAFRPLTPEEVEKIRRLAEGLLFMGEVDRQRGGAALREDLNALRLFISRGTVLQQPTLARLEVGLRAYVGRMRAQLKQGKRVFEQFQRNPTAALTEAGRGGGPQAQVYVELKKTLSKARRKLEGHQMVLQALPPRPSSSSSSQEGGHVLDQLQDSLHALSRLHKTLLRVQQAGPPLPSSSGDNGGGGEVDEEDLKVKAEAVYRVGEEVSKDQIAAAEHLLRACEEFRQRLLEKGGGAAGGGGGGGGGGVGGGQGVVVVESTREIAIRRKSMEAQKKLFGKECWSPVY